MFWRSDRLELSGRNSEEYIALWWRSGWLVYFNEFFVKTNFHDAWARVVTPRPSPKSAIKLGTQFL